jgi:hypothetical protein
MTTLVLIVVVIVIVNDVSLMTDRQDTLLVEYLLFCFVLKERRKKLMIILKTPLSQPQEEYGQLPK